MLNRYCLKMPPTVHCGEHATKEIGKIIKNGPYKKIAIFADSFIYTSGLLRLVTKELEAVGADYYVLADIPSEPSYFAVQTFIDLFKQKGADFIIACGGGSIMDAAKLASILVTDEYGVKELLDAPLLGKKHVPSMMIPTTAGTGAEATPNAIVAVPEKNIKVGIVNDAMIPDYVILDHRFIDDLPLKLSGPTGVDALCHAVECYTSNKANPLSDLFALEACNLIFNNIIPACKKDDPAARSAMQLAAFYAGVAITASGTTAVHALSYPLGGRYHIAHGVSNAMLLCPVMRFNEDAIRMKLAEIYDTVCHDPQMQKSAEVKSDYMITWMERIVRELEIPESLRQFGVSPDELEELVESGMQVTRLLSNNAKTLTAEDAREIYKLIL